jgi:hypothetical protein
VGQSGVGAGRRQGLAPGTSTRRTYTRPHRMLALALSFSDNLPGWLQEPIWWRPLTHAVRIFVLQHQAAGLFFVIFFEELGVPLPAPGDVAIAYGGYLTTTGAIPYPLAYLAVVSGAVLGSACNLTISRRYGRPFIQRFGKYVGVTEERWFERKGSSSAGGRGRSSSAATFRACGSFYPLYLEYSGSLIGFSYRAYLFRR